ncbi:MAG: SPASM domain-containing protein [Bacteroidetes bacterium]|nr:SPASM domain-containing protein [Bacteroidota bacterium]
MNIALFREIIDEIHPFISWLMLYFQGEPYLNPELFDMIRYASGKRLYTVLSTNAQHLDDEAAKKTVEAGPDRLIFSIDGTDQQTYETYRKGAILEKAITAARHITEWKKRRAVEKPHTVFQFVVFKHNYMQISDIKRMGKELGINEIQIKTAQVYDFSKAEMRLPEARELSRYVKNRDGTYSIRSSLPNRCFRLWNSAVLTWDGRLLPCCFDKDGSYKIDTWRPGRFKEIWKGADYRNFRERILRSRKDIDICNNCTEGLRIRSS